MHQALYPNSPDVKLDCRRQAVNVVAASSIEGRQAIHLDPEILLAAIASSAALLFGPPNIKVEAVSHPAAAPVKGAVFMITARHHVSPDQVVVTGRAEGVVDGKRATLRLTLTAAASPGVYGVARQWGAGRPWVLVFTVSTTAHDSNAVAEAVVRVAADGHVLGIDYPMGKLAGGYPWPRKVTPSEIDAALGAMATKGQ